MKKIRFYHWWIYRLYFRMWTPILIDRPHMTRGIHAFMGEWIKRDEARVEALKANAKNTLKLVRLSEEIIDDR